MAKRIFLWALLIVIVLLGIGNAETVIFRLWPLGISYQLPLFFVIMASVILGMFFQYLLAFYRIRQLKKVNRQLKARLREMGSK